MSTGVKILIIGGAGAFGSFYAKQFSKAGFNVSISDIDSNLGKAICEKNRFEWFEGKDLKDFDIVAISVPNDAAVETIRQAAPKMKKSALLFDFCSVKGIVIGALKEIKETDLEVASIHPMHGPRLQNITGQPVACISIKKGPLLEKVEHFFKESKADFFYTTAEEHDEMLSIVQGLTHYSQFVSANVMREMSVDLKKTLKFKSPNYTLFLGLMARVVAQNPELYCQIQLSNPNNEKMRVAFTKNAVELEKLCSGGNFDGLKKKMLANAQVIKDSEIFLFESDRAVNAINYVTSQIKDGIGKKFLFQNIVTGGFHYGTIKGITGNELTITEGKKEMFISISKVRVCSKKELKDWRKKNLALRALDYSILVPAECALETVAFAFSGIRECRFEIVGEYSGEKLPAGKKSITLRANFFEDEDKKSVDEKIKKVIKGLGFSMR
ncbi:MAG: prephenate dehydrogenase/arogenate dehydrogenase family protein [archaeon]